MKAIKKISKHFLAAKTPAEMEDLLAGILTPTEVEAIEKRFEIVKMLKKGIPQHEIAEKVGVGVATVTRGSREIKLGHLQKI